jgi:hypothetical protein
MPHDLGACPALNRRPMVATRTLVAEVVRALAVLALVFLSFAPHAAFAAPGYHGDQAGYDFCGTPPDNPGDHVPCHACRANAVVLPTAPVQADPAFAVDAVCLNVTIWALNGALFDRKTGDPRAPPALV